MVSIILNFWGMFCVLSPSVLKELRLPPSPQTPGSKASIEKEKNMFSIFQDESTINMILDRVLDEYNVLKSSGAQPASQPRPSITALASAAATSQMRPNVLQMPGTMLQPPGMSVQQLPGMPMQQSPMSGMPVSMSQPVLMQHAAGNLMQPPVVSLMQAGQMRLMSPVQNTQVLKQTQLGRNQGQVNRNQQEQTNRNQGQSDRNQGQSDRNQGQSDRNQQGQLDQNQGQSNQNKQGLEEPGKMKAILAASLAATLASKEKKKGISVNTQSKRKLSSCRFVTNSI
jgi:hypothetical protein